MSRIAVILPSAGKSTRFTSSSQAGAQSGSQAGSQEGSQSRETAADEHTHPAARKKPFITLGGEPIWYRSVLPFLRRADVERVVIAVSPEDLEWFRARFGPQLSRLRSVYVVAGGAERADTVERALATIPVDVELIAVHDAARPMVCEKTIDAVVTAAQRTGAAIPATPIASTIKRVGSGQLISATVSREGLWAAQTPQIVRQDWLRQAFAQRGDFQPTDEAQLVELAGHPVEVVAGTASNFKITTQDDLDLAEALLAANGQGSRSA